VIKRTYFFKVEAEPRYYNKRVNKKMPVMTTGFIVYRSWFPQLNIIHTRVLSKAEEIIVDVPIIVTLITKVA